MARALVFPGQGSQQVGMGRDLAEAFETARRVYEEVDDALDQHLSRIIFEGPESDLVLTENAQPALMATSIAVLRVLEEGGFGLGAHAALVAGHSLGEYSALAAARSIALADTARLLKTRGRAMQRAVPVGEGAMAALLGLDLETARMVAEEAAAGAVCDVANDNAPGQVVVSGHAEAVERAVEAAKRAGAKRAMMLSVSAPFHCSLRAPAAAVMVDALAAVTVAEPAVPLISNVAAAPVTDPDTIRAQLVHQVTSMVRWRESVIRMKAEGVEGLVELGAGKVLIGLAKRIEPDLTSVALLAPADIEGFLKGL